jgi:hypothetical protein
MGSGSSSPCRKSKIERVVSMRCDAWNLNALPRFDSEDGVLMHSSDSLT